MRHAVALLAAAGLASCGERPEGVLRPAEPGSGHFSRAAGSRPAPQGRHLVARLKRPVWLRAAPGGRRLARLRTRTEFGSAQVVSVTGRRGGWLQVLSSRLPNRRRGWIPAAHAALRGTDVSLHVDRSRRKLELRVGDRVVRRMAVAVGRPGNETPLGRFAVTDRLRPRDPSSPYGCCAVALTGHQTKLAPGWPGGDRLAIHGTPATRSIGKAVSLGCLRGARRDLEVLLERVPLGAPVFIRA